MDDARYIVQRSSKNNHIHLIVVDDKFDDCPDHVRHQGPWTIIRRGLIKNLKKEYRLALDLRGYIVVTQPTGVFKAEADQAP